MVDGAFFIHRARHLFGILTPDQLATRLLRYSCYHLTSKSNNVHPTPSTDHSTSHSTSKIDFDEALYRIFFYDCPPFNKKLEHPLTKKQIDYSNSDRAKWRKEFHSVLRKKPKVALRLGVVDDVNYTWAISDKKLRKICNKSLTVDDLEENDICLTVKQKGVDMRIGLDIASIAYKKQAQRIVLISGDSDFVPAAKLARREGMEFVLDPMWSSIKPDLQEHIDRLRSCFPKPHLNPQKC